MNRAKFLFLAACFGILFGAIVYPENVEAAYPIDCYSDSSAPASDRVGWVDSGGYAQPVSETLGIVGTVEVMNSCGTSSGAPYCTAGNYADSYGSCGREKFYSPSTNGATCFVRDRCASGFGYRDWTSDTDLGHTSKWDSTDQRCVVCNAGKEESYVGDTSGTYVSCTDTTWSLSDDTCESACGGSPECDEKTPGTSWATGTNSGTHTCSSSCVYSYTPPAPSCSGSIILYEDVGPGGACRGFNADDSNLVNSGWNDRASSVVINSGTWTLYDNINYDTTAGYLTLSSSNSNLHNNGWGDRASSLKSGSAPPTNPCGNGQIDSGEQCDGSNLNGQTCSSRGFTGGTLSCTSSCTFNTASCTTGGGGGGGSGICTDTDSPSEDSRYSYANTRTKGTVTNKNGQPSTDYCIDGTQLREYICSGNGDGATWWYGNNADYSAYNCAAAWGIGYSCYDGACAYLYTYYRDYDSDGYGSTTYGTTQAPSQPSGYVGTNSDCNDGNANVNPGNAEACDGADNNCDGTIDGPGVCATNQNCGTYGRACSTGQVCQSGSCSNPDITAPSVTASVSPSPAKTSQQVTVTVSASDAESPVTQTQVYADGSLKTTCPAASCSYASTYSSGTHAYYGTATSSGGTGRDPSSGTKSFAVNYLPAAALSASPASGYQPLSVTFTLSGSDTDGTISSWSLNYGDGQSDSGSGNPGGATRAHTYNSGGTFTATLAVTDNMGESGSNQKPVTVTPNVAPMASISGISSGTWYGAPSATLTFNFNDADGNLAKCWYRVKSGAEAWSAWRQLSGCTGGSKSISQSISVGPSGDCHTEGVDACNVEIYSRDSAGTGGGATSATSGLPQ